jgi:hypothetical protein
VAAEGLKLIGEHVEVETHKGADAQAQAHQATALLPRLMHRPKSDREDMRGVAVHPTGPPTGGIFLGQAMLRAWHLTHDIRAVGRNSEEFRDNLRRIREQVLQEPEGDPDTPILVRRIDEILNTKVQDPSR